MTKRNTMQKTEQDHLSQPVSAHSTPDPDLPPPGPNPDDMPPPGPNPNSDDVPPPDHAPIHEPTRPAPPIKA
jgi:hypothetical protein